MAAKNTKHKKRRAKKPLPAVFAGMGTALLAVYIGFGIYYNKHFFPKTTIGSTLCGNQTAAWLEASNVAAAKKYSLSVRDRMDNVYTIEGPDISYEYNTRGEEEAILKKQNGFTWPVAVFQTHTHELNQSFTYDADALGQIIDTLPLFDEDYITPPKDAYLDIREDDYEVVKEEPGNTPVRDEIAAEITAAIEDQKNAYTLSDNCYEKPAVYASDKMIADTAAQIDQYTSATIQYDIDGAEEYLDKGDILSMLDINKEGKVTINDDKVTAFVQKLASTYNTYGDVRTFATSKGDDVKIGGGDYGWVINKAKEKEQILEDLKNGTPVEREPVYEQTAIKSGLDDIGDTYIEIDYSNQHLWFYREGELITETDIVSGNIRHNNGSPDGVFKIAYKERDATLIGENYASDVKYFMPFAYNVGIHDASWRSKFGDEIYKTSGSHGCINVPEKIAKKLFKEVETGTPVIAYYREPVTLTAENARISNAYSYKEKD